MTLEQRRRIAAELNKIPYIFLTKYPPVYPDDSKSQKDKAQELGKVVRQLEIEKKLFWSPFKSEWVAE